jgi:hypothetical protein
LQHRFDKGPDICPGLCFCWCFCGYLEALHPAQGDPASVVFDLIGASPVSRYSALGAEIGRFSPQTRRHRPVGARNGKGERARLGGPREGE